MTGLRLHVLQGRPVVQGERDMRAPQIMRGQVANSGALAAETEQTHNGLGAHRCIGFEFRIAPGRHGREETVVGASLRPPQGQQGSLGRFSGIGNGGDTPFVALAMPHGHGLVLKVNIVPAQRHNLRPAQTGIDHQAQQGVIAYAHQSRISRPYIQQPRDFAPLQRSLAAAAAALAIHPLHFGELEHAPPLYRIPVAFRLGFLQPVQQAQHMRFPGLAGGLGDIILLEESRDILEAEIEGVESSPLGIGAPLAVGIGVDPARCGRQALGNHIDQYSELLLACRAEDGQGAAVAGAELLYHVVFPLN